MRRYGAFNSNMNIRVLLLLHKVMRKSSSGEHSCRSTPGHEVGYTRNSSYVHLTISSVGIRDNSMNLQTLFHDTGIQQGYHEALSSGSIA